MDRKETELEKLERLAESLTNFGDVTRKVRNSYTRLESKIDDEYSRLARVNDLLRESLLERDRLANFLNNILESVNSGVIVADREGKINIFNSVAEFYTGIPAQKALNNKYSEVMGESASPGAEDILTGEKEFVSGEKTLCSRDGIEMPVGYSITRLRDYSDNSMEGMVEIIYDLTENKKLEEKLKRISTLAALGEMAATVAHEIRNPLAGISGFTSLLARDLKDDKKNIATVNKINKGVNALNVIVTRLLDFTRFVDPNKLEVEPLSVIKETLAEFKADSESHNHTFEIESGNGKLIARLDPDIFRQIIYNLAKNAVQANPNGGKVIWKLKNLSPAGFSLDVEDDGPGIPEKIKERIFTPFFTTKTNGIGLGLAIVRKLTELHGGRVMAANRQGGGAVFTVEFPDSEGEHP